jgi:hypothetical protein
MKAVGSSPSRTYLPVGTTPTTVRSLPPTRMVRPTAFPCGKNRSTKRWFTTTTPADRLSSRGSKPRPSTSEMPIASK